MRRILWLSYPKPEPGQRPEPEPGPKPEMATKMTQPSGISPDAKAAQALLTELRTRIATQRLHFSHGDEKAALKSVYELFDFTRKTIHANPGCKAFVEAATGFLNGAPRAFLAEWHRRSLAGELDTRDGAVAFRGKLRPLQEQFRVFAGRLHEMAYDAPIEDFPPEEDPVAPPDDDLAFGIFKRDMFAEPGDDHIVDRINADEAAYIAARRGEALDANGKAVHRPKNARGLAFSGGGIRSASFCLGVAQVLADRGLLSNFDLLSTVSGGGYTGGFLVRRLAEGTEADLGRPDGPDTDPIRFVRRRASYLDTGSFGKTLGLVVNLLAGTLLNWTVPAALVAILAVITYGLTVTVPEIWAYDLHLAAFSAALGFLAYAFVPHVLVKTRHVMMWIFWGVTGAALVTHLIGLGYAQFLKMGDNWSAATTAVLSLGAALPALSRFVPALAKEWLRAIGNQSVLVVASISVPILLLLFGYLLFWLGGRPLFDLPAQISSQNPLFVWLGLDQVFAFSVPLPDTGLATGTLLLLAIAAFLSLTASTAIDVNATGPHWLYRKGLSETFVQTQKDPVTDVPLRTLDPDKKAPYILLNAVANFPNSDRIELRERQGDFFLFSKHWCGTPLSGYRPTGHWKRGRREIDLATAIATSGAAVAPHMALLSVTSATALLTLFNLRLAVWLRRPEKGDKPPSSGGYPGGIKLLQEMFKWGLKDDADWMLLSDGAHLENSGMYELLRRRCKFIVAVDASAEPNASFRTMLTLVRHARIDLGVDIRPDLDELRPDEETGLSRAHGVICDIDYKGANGQVDGKGILLFIKLSMTGDESALIQAYRTAHPEFPNQPTADQFFDEHQFEAYRQLGAHAAESLFKEALLRGNPVTDVSSWLTQLYASIPPSEAALRAVTAAQAPKSG